MSGSGVTNKLVQNERNRHKELKIKLSPKSLARMFGAS